MEQIEQTISTLEIAEMMGVQHWQILRKLDGTKKSKGVIQIFNDNKIVVVDYFIKSSYKDDKGEERPCYKATKLGCDFLANKFTGEKGVIFTAKYVKRFHDMEQAITESTQQIPQLTTEEIVDWKLNDLHKRVKELEDKPDNFCLIERKLSDLHKRVKTLEAKEADKPRTQGLARLTPRENTWYEKNRNRIWRIHYDKDIEIKDLYHIILEECSKYYDLDEAERLYRDQKGCKLIYPIDVVEYFPELQDIADQVLDCFESEKGGVC